MSKCTPDNPITQAKIFDSVTDRVKTLSSLTTAWRTEAAPTCLDILFQAHSNLYLDSLYHCDFLVSQLGSFWNRIGMLLGIKSTKV